VARPDWNKKSPPRSTALSKEGNEAVREGGREGGRERGREQAKNEVYS
jgi:hypothetical protein